MAKARIMSRENGILIDKWLNLILFRMKDSEGKTIQIDEEI